MRSRVQPIAVQDVVHLLACSLRGEPRNRHYDVGGDEQVSYPELLATFALVAGLKRFQFFVPLVPTAVVGLLASWVTGMPRGTVTALVQSLHGDMVCAGDDVRSDIGGEHTYLSLDEALRRSLSAVEKGTSRDADPQAPAPTDPEWSGGAVTVDGDVVVQRPRTRFGSLLLGFRTRRAVRRTPDRLV
jgi:hypothetical protein